MCCNTRFDLLQLLFKLTNSKKRLRKIKSLSNQGIFKTDFSIIKNKIESFYKDTTNYKLTLLRINSEYADMGIVQYKNGFVFCSSRPTNAVIERKHTWTNQAFLKLFYCENTNNNWTEPTLFSSEIKTKYNLGPLCFSNKGKELWITENYSENNQLSSDKNTNYELSITN